VFFGGNLSLINTEILTKKNISLNSTLIFNSSSIVSEGCINISNSNITVLIPQNILNDENILLLNSTQGCLNGDPFKITILNLPPCTSPQTIQNSFIFSIQLIKQSNCETGKNEGLEPWVIILIIVGAVLVFLVIIIIFAVPQIRRAIFPTRAIREEMKKNVRERL